MPLACCNLPPFAGGRPEDEPPFWQARRRDAAPQGAGVLIQIDKIEEFKRHL
jgi:hypothetical protein